MTPWDTRAYDTYTVIPFSLGSVGTCRLIGINSINRATDCLQIFDESGVAWRLQREVVGAQCRVSLQVRIDIAPGGHILHRDITGGRFLTPEETSSAT